MIQCLPSHVSWQDYTAGLSSGTLGILAQQRWRQDLRSWKSSGQRAEGKGGKLGTAAGQEVVLSLGFFYPVEDHTKKGGPRNSQARAKKAKRGAIYTDGGED